MKNRFLLFLMSCVWLLFSNQATANWYEVTGTSTVVASKEVAKVHALEDAIYRAVTFSGADIASISSIRFYLPLVSKNYWPNAP